jgi:ceramide glucosyltransferase
MSDLVLTALAGFAGFATALHLATNAMVYRRFARPALPETADHPGLSVLRPVCGLEPGLEATLASSFTKLSQNYEVIFCIAAQSDPALPLVRALIAANPEVAAKVLIGNEAISGNPKLNNLAKGWKAARHEWIVMIDSNVALPANYIQTLFAHWTKGTGLVTSPPAGMAPEGLWAAVEAGFLNSYQDRWQLASDELGNGFAQGKVLMWQRSLLDQAGGLATLGRDLAEDVASTKVVRAAGLKVRVLTHPFAQPLGRRPAGEVWLRQLRWARVRRAGFPLLFAAEIFSGPTLPALAIGLLCIKGWLPMATLPGFALLWYGAEWALAVRAGWPATAGQIVAWILRDAMSPLLWLLAFGARGFVWRGTAMAQEVPATFHPPIPVHADTVN